MGVPLLEVARLSLSSLKAEVVKYSQPFPQFDAKLGVSKKESSLVI